jgi:hypothetical protein
MPKSATDLMQDILFAAVIDAVAAMKAASKGLPNNLLRDLNAVHANTTLPDLPAEVQAAIQANVRAAFTKLQREGYVVAPAGAAASPDRRLPAEADRADRRPRTAPPAGARDKRGPRPPGPGRRPPRGGQPPKA